MEESVADLAPYAPFFGREATAVFADLQAFSRLLHQWQKVQNLVSRETADTLWARHILDSLQLLPLIRGRSSPLLRGVYAEKPGFDAVSVPPPALTVADIGSGGGFPALPLAIALKETPVRFHLIESNGRKCAFLSAAIRTLGLAGRVHNARIEGLAAGTLGEVDLVTSRALAPLPLLLTYVAHIAPESRALLHKGREYGEEIKEADSAWAFDVVKHDSRTDPEGVILDISAIRRR